MEGAISISRRPSKSQIVPALQNELCDAPAKESALHEYENEGTPVTLEDSEDFCTDDLCSTASSSECDDVLDAHHVRRTPPCPLTRPRKSILKPASIDMLTASRSDSSAFRMSAPVRSPLKATPLRRRALSMPVTFDSDDEEPPVRGGGADDDTSRRKAPVRRSSSVTFDKVHFREHGLTVGDHPDCTYGPPVSLDWDVVKHKEIDLELFEDGRRDTRRNMRQMRMNAFHRKKVLTFRFGLTETELDAATKERDKTRRNRSVTRSLLPAMKIEDGLRSVGRKFRRAVDSDVRKSEKESKDFVRRHSSRTLNSLDDSTLQELRDLDSDEDEA